MAALCTRAGHYIFALWFLSSSIFFPRLISAAADWMSTLLPYIVWPSANLECRSEMCCTRLVFVMSWPAPDTINPCIKFEVPYFIHAKDVVVSKN